MSLPSFVIPAACTDVDLAAGHSVGNLVDTSRLGPAGHQIAESVDRVGAAAREPEASSRNDATRIRSLLSDRSRPATPRLHHEPVESALGPRPSTGAHRPTGPAVGAGARRGNRKDVRCAQTGSAPTA